MGNWAKEFDEPVVLIGELHNILDETQNQQKNGLTGNATESTEKRKNLTDYFLSGG